MDCSQGPPCAGSPLQVLGQWEGGECQVLPSAAAIFSRPPPTLRQPATPLAIPHYQRRPDTRAHSISSLSCRHPSPPFHSLPVTNYLFLTPKTASLRPAVSLSSRCEGSVFKASRLDFVHCRDFGPPPTRPNRKRPTPRHHTSQLPRGVGTSSPFLVGPCPLPCPSPQTSSLQHRHRVLPPRFLPLPAVLPTTCSGDDGQSATSLTALEFPRRSTFSRSQHAPFRPPHL